MKDGLILLIEDVNVQSVLMAKADFFGNMIFDMS